MLSGRMGQSFIDISTLLLPQFVIQVLINKTLFLSLFFSTTQYLLVRRYSEINRSVEGDGERRRRRTDEREILVREEGGGPVEGPACCSGTKMAMRKRREQGERTPQSTFPSRGARKCACPLGLISGPGRGPRETGPPAGRVGAPPRSSAPHRRRRVHE